MEYDYSKLLKRIKEVFGCNANFALKMKISERTISLKLSNKVDFKQGEIFRACEILEIQHEELAEYFFKKKTQDN